MAGAISTSARVLGEHAMCAVVNGMTLTGLRAYGSGFLIFTDYARGAIRLASLMDLPVIHIPWTCMIPSQRRRGRTHARAGRAARLPARHPGDGGDPACRRQRDGGSLAHLVMRFYSTGRPRAGSVPARRCRCSTVLSLPRRPAWPAAPTC